MKQIGLWGPKTPPTVRTVTDTLRALNRVFTGPTVVSLTDDGLVGMPDGPVRLAVPHYGRETLPGNSQKFDAVASARRLLAALRDLEPAG